MKLGKNADGSVKTYNLKEDHTFIVVANSALWKSLSDLEVGKLIIPFIFSQNVKMAVQALHAAAAKAQTTYRAEVCTTVIFI